MKNDLFKSMRSTTEERKINEEENNILQRISSPTSSSQPPPLPPIQSKIPVRSPPSETKFSQNATLEDSSFNSFNSPQSPTKTFGA